MNNLKKNIRSTTEQENKQQLSGAMLNCQSYQGSSSGLMEPRALPSLVLRSVGRQMKEVTPVS